MSETHIIMALAVLDILPACVFETGAACESVANPSKHTPARRASILTTAANPLAQLPINS